MVRPPASGPRGYRDIKREMFRRIRAREWPPGARLPGEVDLAAEFGCARATVNRAMRELATDGIIERRRKAGSRVRLVPSRQVTFEIPLVRAELTGDCLVWNGDTLVSDALMARVVGNSGREGICVTIDRKDAYDDDDMKVEVER